MLVIFLLLTPPPSLTWQWIELAFFAGFYLTFVLLSLILLLNLLIAMMGNTFVEVQDEAVLEWRVLYARNILRLESLAEVWARPPFQLWTTRGGEQDAVNGRWYMLERSVEEVGDEEEAFEEDAADKEETAKMHAASTMQGEYRKRRVRIKTSTLRSTKEQRDGRDAAAAPSATFSASSPNTPHTSPDGRASKGSGAGTGRSSSQVKSGAIWTDAPAAAVKGARDARRAATGSGFFSRPMQTLEA